MTEALDMLALLTVAVGDTTTVDRTIEVDGTNEVDGAVRGCAVVEKETGDCVSIADVVREIPLGADGDVDSLAAWFWRGANVV